MAIQIPAFTMEIGEGSAGLRLRIELSLSSSGSVPELSGLGRQFADDDKCREVWAALRDRLRPVLQQALLPIESRIRSELLQLSCEVLEEEIRIGRASKGDA